MARPTTQRQCKLGNRTLVLYEFDDVEVIIPSKLWHKKDADPDIQSRGVLDSPEEEERLPVSVIEIPENEAQAFEDSDLKLVDKIASRSVFDEQGSSSRRRKLYKTENGKLFIETGTLVLKFHESVEGTVCQAFIEKNELIILRRFPFSNNMYLVEVPANQNVLDVSIQFEEEDIIQFAEPNFLEQIPKRFVPNDSFIKHQWQHHDVNTGDLLGGQGGALIPQKKLAHVQAEDSWDYTRGEHIKVAVIDQGFNVDHDDLKTQIDDLSASIEGGVNPGIVISTSEIPKDSHGTECAGMIVASQNNSGTVGIAHKSKVILLAIKDSPFNSMLSLAMMIAYAADPSIVAPWRSASDGAHVISCSIGPNGIGFDPNVDNPVAITGGLREAIEFATREGRGGKGIPIFWANDNAPSLVEQDQVTSHPYVVSVSRSWWKDQYHGSAYGTDLDLVAPGVSVYTTVFDKDHPTQNNIYNSTTGCSFAAPLAAGIGSLILANKQEPSTDQLLSINDTLSAAEVKDILVRTTAKVGLEVPCNPHWVDAEGRPILTPKGLLHDEGDHSLLVEAVNKNKTEIRVHNNSDFKVGQAIMIGLRTLLADPVQVDPQNSPAVNLSVKVASTDLFSSSPNPDLKFTIREFGRSHLISGPNSKIESKYQAAYGGANGIYVQDTTGFTVGDMIEINPGQSDMETIMIADVRTDTLMLLASPVNKDFKWYKHIPVRRVDHKADNPPTTAIALDDFTLEMAAVHHSYPNVHRTFVETVGAEIRVIKEVHPDGKTLVIDALENDHPDGTPVIGGRIPAFSPYYGKGRVDALAAITETINYSHDSRDLVIRNHLLDDGGAATDNMQKDIDSPDIWVRNLDPVDNAFSGDTQATTSNYQTAGPDLPVARGGDNWLYARVRNRGNQFDALDFTMRFYLMMTDGTLPISKKDFRFSGLSGPHTNTNPTFYSLRYGTMGTHFLREKRFFNRQRDVNYYNNLVPAPTSDPIPGAIHIPMGFPSPGGDIHALTPGNQVPSPPLGSDVRIAQVAWPSNLQPSLPLGAKEFFQHLAPQGAPSAQLLAQETPGSTTLKIERTERYHVGQTLLIDLPGDPMYGSVVIDSIDGETITLQSSPNPMDPLPHETRITALRSLKANITVDAAAGNVLEVDQAGEFEEGQFVLIGDPGYIDNELHRIKEIDYSGPHHTLHLFDDLVQESNFTVGTKVTVVQGQPQLYALVEITPHDGEIAGEHVYDNNNISFKKVHLQSKISFLDQDGIKTLSDNIQTESDGSPLGLEFSVRLEDQTSFITEHVRVIAHMFKTDGTIETQVFAFDETSGAWASVHPAHNWLSIESPNISGTTNDATAHQTDITFKGVATVSNAYKKIRLTTSVQVQNLFQTVGTHEVMIASIAGLPDGNSTAIQAETGQAQLAGTQRVHCFADMSGLSQNSSQAFGPVDSQRFRLSSMFSANGPVKTYAALDSMVFVQKNPANDTFNLILRPLRQPEIGFTKVKYFIYRGIRKGDIESLAEAGKIRTSTNHPRADFIDFLQKIQQDLDSNTALSLEMLNWDQKESFNLLDSYFMNTNSNAQLPVVKRGMCLGSFDHSTHFGFEIILAEGAHHLTLASVQSANHILDISGIAVRSERKSKKEEVLNYLDPAAFFGLHFHGKVLYPDPAGGDPNSIQTINYSEADIYTHIVSKFFTRNTLYLDIRDEHGNSYNYLENLDLGGDDSGKALKIGDLPPENQPLQAEDFHTQGWPILIRNSASVNTNAKYNAVFLQFPIPQQTDPILYLEYGFGITPNTNNTFIEGENLYELIQVDSMDPTGSRITIQKKLETDLDSSDTIYLLEHGGPGLKGVIEVLGSTQNPNNPNFTDIIIEPGALPSNAGQVQPLGKVRIGKISKPVGVSFPNVPAVNPNERINLAQVLKIRYFNKFARSEREIQGVDNANNEFSIRGNFDGSIAHNPSITVFGSQQTGQPDYDGEYQVINATELPGVTMVSVSPAIQAGVSQHGKMSFPPNEVLSQQHFTDRAFGPFSSLFHSFPIESIEVDPASPTEAKLTILGDHVALFDLSEYVSIDILENVHSENNGNYSVDNAELVQNNTVLTISSFSAFIPGTSNMGRIKLMYSPWTNPAPIKCRWITGFDKRYIDMEQYPVDKQGKPIVGAAYIGQNGIALENRRIVFFSTPMDFFRPASSHRSSSFVSINGGISTQDSFLKVLEEQNQRLRLSPISLRIPNENLFLILDYEDVATDSAHDVKKENFLALCLTNSELSRLNGVAEMSFSNLQDHFLVLRNRKALTDENGFAYLQFEVQVAGVVENAQGKILAKEEGAISPVIVYTRADNPMIYTSQEFATLEVFNKTTLDYQETLQQLFDAIDPSYETVVNNFANDLTAAGEDYLAVQAAIDTQAAALWTHALSATYLGGSSPFDDRHLYHSRLKMRKLLKDHMPISLESERLEASLEKLERRSRGLESVNFDGNGRKVLLIGFDPYHLDPSVDPNYNTLQSNPGGSVALHYHNQDLYPTGGEVEIQSVILPVRYKDLDQGIVEKLVLPYLQGPEKVDMIISINHNRESRFDIERFASKYRNPDHADSSNQKNKAAQYYRVDNSSSTPSLEKVTPGQRLEFLETNLPAAKLIPTQQDTYDVVWNEGYTSNDPADQQADSEPGSHTINNGEIQRGPAPDSASKARKGSAGDFIFNEVFFRLLCMREDLTSDTKVGQLSLPRYQTGTEDFERIFAERIADQFYNMLMSAMAT